MGLPWRRRPPEPWSTPGESAGLLYLLAPTGIIAALLTRTIGPGARDSPNITREADRLPRVVTIGERSAVLSGATICRSIVFYGLNTFLGLYFMDQWHQTAEQGSRASVVFLGTSIVGTLLGGWLADRFGRRAVIRTGFAGAAVFLALFLRTSDRTWATALLDPPVDFHLLADERPGRAWTGISATPRRNGLGRYARAGRERRRHDRAVLGLWAERQGFGVVFGALWVVLLLATVQAFSLPPVGREPHARPRLRAISRLSRSIRIE